MNANPSSDFSLYELVLHSDSPLTALQVSPSTLKSLNDSLLNLLIDQKIPAVVWAKLPRGDVWWTGIEQYVNLPGVAQAVYLFTQQRDESDETGGSATSATHPSDAHSPKAIAATARVPVVNLQLPTDSSLRREYFLFIWSPQFRGGMFAHRPRSVQLNPIPNSIPLSFDLLADSYGQTSQLLESTQERKQLLLALCSLKSHVVQAAIAGLSTAMSTLSLQLVEQSASVPALDPAAIATEVVQHWQSLFTALTASAKTADLSTAAVDCLEYLLNRHLQHQEELWQRNSSYRKQAENAETLRLQNEELTTTLRLKDDFLNNVGQELRTPLTTIKTALSLLNSPSIKPPQRQRYMDLIAKECDRQNSLITSLLDLTHLDQEAEQAALPPVRLVDVVPSVVSTYQPIAEEKGVRLSYTVPEDLPPVVCMTNWLKQIVINLVHNGIKYTPSEGNVWVRAKQQGDYVQLEVRDTGIGIAPSEIPKIFDRFYRVRQSADDSSGAGLGLTIVQQLLLHCGGSISVKSKVAEGSTFNVLLPIYRSPAEGNT
ncbi:MAG: DICT sensory domain-containing protein [Leptolyngbyaceae cyanobacterium bins.349]|nr:DICT sensory domain-containing protein [Leptolyngbyaceae cyanobacterium bins.349]